MEKGLGKKITLEVDTSFLLFDCRDTNDLIDCNFFADSKLNLESLGGICVKIVSDVHDEGC